MRISDWSSDVCSSDLRDLHEQGLLGYGTPHDVRRLAEPAKPGRQPIVDFRTGFLNADDKPFAAQIGPSKSLPRRNVVVARDRERSEEHTSELQSLMRISYAVFCLTKTRTAIAPHQHVQN